jgi:hypothetical protein
LLAFVSSVLSVLMPPPLLSMCDDSEIQNAESALARLTRNVTCPLDFEKRQTANCLRNRGL